MIIILIIIITMRIIIQYDGDDDGDDDGKFEREKIKKNVPCPPSIDFTK